ncbi:ABC transporter substrate-binding protein [Pasteurellaceae bacterium HPA106]|uniref:ABC transporter substrate-binding protein n=1 Tax=Spirabiliibacterium pneumoniae TaxID=221400 RepID=UPI001AADBD2D|nr:ABC transporter substrate-binding protein [Spirabiliibacterium pneumoniae]MBE2896627.1 ABC transporter substrate-binding protein [Spirabiliibacterium pneumoniae]
MRLFLLLLSLIFVQPVWASPAPECVGCENLTPEHIKKVYASNPVLLYQLYAVDKSKIAGLNFEFYPIEKQYLDPSVTEQTVVGGFFGQGKTPNMEAVLALKPDLILASGNVQDKYREIFVNAGVPVLYIDALTLEQSLNSFTPLADILGVSARGEKLHAYAQQSVDMAKSAVYQTKPRVYYAFGKDGLKSECEKSSFGDLITLAGGEVVLKCENTKQNSRVSVNFEQVLSLNPDMIIAYDKAFYDSVYQDEKWQVLSAVKNKQVFLIPRKPFSWMGKPASFMRFLGIRWLLKTLHPNEFTQINIRDEAKQFYQLFLSRELSEADLNDILNETP